MLTVFIMHKHSPPEHKDRTVINVRKWLDNPYTGCSGHFTGYGHEFAWLRYARVDKRTKLFSIPCDDELPVYKFQFGKDGTVLREWMKTMEVFPHSEVSKFGNTTVETATIVIMRFEAHNLYHTLCEWYNVFVVAKLLKLNPKHVGILFMDDRPRGLMDDTWMTLFGHMTRYSKLPANAIFKNLIWNVIGYESPVNFHNLKILPYVDDFYNFFIRSLGISEAKVLNCKMLHVTIIWRRDYMSHPERQNDTGGLIHRKFQNENEILDVINDMLHGHLIQTVILEHVGMNDQVKLLTNTDLLIGMHGAGMAHVMILPKHAAVFETFPDYWGFQRHFKAFARWRGVKYLGWQNKDSRNEYPNFYTRIPADVVRSHLEVLINYLCPT